MSDREFVFLPSCSCQPSAAAQRNSGEFRCKHHLTLVARGDGAIPIDAFEVFEPPLK